VRLEETPWHWLGENRILVSMLAVGALLVVVTVWWNVGRHPDIADAMSRVNCQQLYQAAQTRAESLAVDGQASAAYRERKNGYLHPDVRCAEIRYYDSLRSH
jgi:hypothetical protein